MSKEILDSIKEIGEKVEGFKTEVSADVDAKVKNTNDQLEVLKAAQEKSISKEDFVKEIDKLEKAYSKQKLEAKQKSFSDALGAAFKEKESAFSDFATKGGKGQFDMQVKDITTASLTMTDPQAVPGVTAFNAGFARSPQIPHMRNYIKSASTDAGIIYYAQKLPKTGTGPGYQAGQGAAKPKFDVMWEPKSAPFVTIAGILKTSTQALRDIKSLRGYIAAQAPEELLKFEDAQILYGAGTANTLEGLMTSTTQTATAGTDIYETLLGAFKTLATATIPEIATHAFINAGDYYDELGKRGSDGHFLFPQVMWGGQGIQVAGVPVIPITQLGAGDMITGDFNSGVQLFYNEALNIRFFEQNVDDVEKNMITIRVEESVAMPIYKPLAFVKIDAA